MSPSEWLCTPTTRYEERLPGSVYEGFVEAIVLRFSAALFPGYHALPCKPYFDTPHGGVYPDLVLIREDFTGWGLVEVEVQDHSANGHVKPQIGKLANASPDQKAFNKITEALTSHATADDIERAVYRRPQVFLVTHGATPVMQHHLDALAVDAIDLRIFSGGANEYKILAMDRSRQTRALKSLLQRSGSPMMRAIWTLADEVIPEFDCRKEVSVAVAGESTTWSVKRTANGYILRMPTHLVDRITFRRASVDVVNGDGRIHLTPQPLRG